MGPLIQTYRIAQLENCATNNCHRQGRLANLLPLRDRARTIHGEHISGTYTTVQS